MGQPFVGEIRIFAGNFAPAGWMFCEGQLLPISEYETLFNLIGTTYGGDGQSTFALPDMRGRIPLHFGNGTTLAETGGVEAVTLTTAQLPAHSHPMMASSSTGTQLSPAGNVTAQSDSISLYRAGAGVSQLASQSVTSTGGSQPHTNFQPYLCLDFIISLYGIFPSPT
jgi:microcystin-dependent protein